MNLTVLVASYTLTAHSCTWQQSSTNKVQRQTDSASCLLSPAMLCMAIYAGQMWPKGVGVCIWVCVHDVCPTRSPSINLEVQPSTTSGMWEQESERSSD